MNVGKATDGMLDLISSQKRRILYAIDFAALSAEAQPEAAVFFKELAKILDGTSTMLNPELHVSAVTPEPVL